MGEWDEGLETTSTTIGITIRTPELPLIDEIHRNIITIA